LFQKTNIVFGEHTQIFYLILKVGDAFNTHTQSITTVNGTVDSTILEYVGIDHAAAQNFYPAGIFTKGTALAMADVAGYIQLSRRFSKGEVGGAQADFGLFPEHFLAEIVEQLSQIGIGDIFIHIKSFDLMKEAMCPVGNSLVAVNPSGQIIRMGGLVFSITWFAPTKYGCAKPDRDFFL
jgi:hypothetical protein